MDVLSSTPFWMAAVEAALPDGERLRARVVSGLLVGFGGILLLAWPDVTKGSGAAPWPNEARGSNGSIAPARGDIEADTAMGADIVGAWIGGIDPDSSMTGMAPEWCA